MPATWATTKCTSASTCTPTWLTNMSVWRCLSSQHHRHTIVLRGPRCTIPPPVSRQQAGPPGLRPINEQRYQTLLPHQARLCISQHKPHYTALKPRHASTLKRKSLASTGPSTGMPCCAAKHAAKHATKAQQEHAHDVLYISNDMLCRVLLSQILLSWCPLKPGAPADV